MTRRPAALLALLAVALLPAVLACAWDYDTTKMERTRFPGTLELVTGKFLRHSPEFYRWRIENRLKRLEADPANLALLDDLAVAYDKVGRHDLAVATAERAGAIRPGRYETEANLGTFHFHAGNLCEGLPHIDRALAINPDAHFGREKYQKLLAEYVLSRPEGALLLAEVKSAMATGTFAEFIHLGADSRRDKPEEVAAAIKGVLGMMKFGNHASPVLLEALGSLLTQDWADPTADAKLLAARAYLKASAEVPEGPGREAYRALARRALEYQTPRRDQMGQIALAQVEADFRAELAEAETWYADLRARELAWVASSEDPDAEFDALYKRDPELGGLEVRDPSLTGSDWAGLLLGGACLAAALVATGLLTLVGVWGVRRWRRPAG